MKAKAATRAHVSDLKGNFVSNPHKSVPLIGIVMSQLHHILFSWTSDISHCVLILSPLNAQYQLSLLVLDAHISAMLSKQELALLPSGPTAAHPCPGHHHSFCCKFFKRPRGTSCTDSISEDPSRCPSQDSTHVSTINFSLKLTISGQRILFFQFKSQGPERLAEALMTLGFLGS